MASLSFSLSNSPNPNQLTQFPSRHPCRYLSIKVASPEKRYRRGAVRMTSDKKSYDVIVVGAGIIGLSIARQFLIESDYSVAVVDAAVPCSGATGAGQGYIWMVHKVPGSEKWELALRSRNLWKKFANDIMSRGLDPEEILGWKKTGSLLVSKTMTSLKKNVDELLKAGLKAELLSSTELQKVEPAIVVGKEGGAVFLPYDYQIDARRSVAFIEKENRMFGRYGEYYNQPVTGLLRSGNGKVEGVQTSKNLLYSNKAVIICSGCWTGDLIKDMDVKFDMPVKPRKGHLLVIENFKSFRLNHGVMEVGYIGHQSNVDDEESLSISMTATMDSYGNLVLGSSRQFVGFNTEINEDIISQILERAKEFFPCLRELPVLEKSREIRVGLRPFMPGGKPMIGPVPGLSNVFVAAGHEGEGLSLALGTAEMVADMVLGNPTKVDNAPYKLF